MANIATSKNRKYEDDLSPEEQQLIRDAETAKGNWTAGGSAVGSGLGALAGGIAGGFLGGGAGAIPGAGMGAGLGGTLGGWVGSLIGGGQQEQAQAKLDALRQKELDEQLKLEEEQKSRERVGDLLSPWLSSIRGMV